MRHLQQSLHIIVYIPVEDYARLGNHLYLSCESARLHKVFQHLQRLFVFELYSRHFIECDQIPFSYKSNLSCGYVVEELGDGSVTPG